MGEGDGDGEGEDEGDGEGDTDVGGGLGKDRMGEGDWETGRVGVEEGDGETVRDGRPDVYSQVAGPSGGVQALAGACPGAVTAGA